MTGYTKVTKDCLGCGKSFSGHPNRRFCKRKCKDRHHNTHNPRGYFAHLHPLSPERMHEQACNAMEAGWDGHKP